MPFFPPTGPSNNTALISDDKYVQDVGPARFPDYEQAVTVYWPWLSWDEEDVSIGDHQQAIMRCCLLGDSGVQLYGLVPDSVGSIIQLGRPEATQFWEVIHYFDWFTPESPSKKLSLVWARLWVPAPAPVPAEPGSSCFLGWLMDPDVNYVATNPGGLQQWWRAPHDGTGALHHVKFQILSGNMNALLNIFGGTCTALTGIIQNVGPGCYEFNAPVGQFDFLMNVGGLDPHTYTLEYGLGPCP